MLAFIFHAQKVIGFKHLRALRQYCTYMIFSLLRLAKVKKHTTDDWT